ncbi:hypothetical protein [Lutibacter citreus]|uniref:hypothetical protein n=1 Tax=Lutibacter citreus TaxID=2138210 RepID=UPI000DBE43F5|nr:hypothetical protein [Lutibacter citreus]
MKKIILGLLFIGFVMQSYGQDVLFQAKLKKENVPVAVIEAINGDFGDVEMMDFYAIPIEIIDEDVYINQDINNDEDYDTYQVTLKGGNDKIIATYNKDGMLISSIEYLKDVLLPAKIRNTINKAFPGWYLTKDKYKMTHFSKAKAKERYKIIIKKGKEMKVVYMDEKGEVLKVHHKVNFKII